MGLITCEQVRQDPSSPVLRQSESQEELLLLLLLLLTVSFSSPQQQSLDKDFLKDSVMDRLKDDVPEVVAAALKVLEVSEVTVGRF